MLRLIIWAMSTGFVTGAVWFAMHFFRRGVPDGGVPSTPPLREDEPLPLPLGLPQATHFSLSPDGRIPEGGQMHADQHRAPERDEYVPTPRP